jgi:hypothetical protein
MKCGGMRKIRASNPARVEFQIWVLFNPLPVRKSSDH